MSHGEQQTLKAWLYHQPRPGSPVCGRRSSRELPCSPNKAFFVPLSGAVRGGNLHTIASYFVCTSVPGVLEKAEIIPWRRRRRRRRDVKERRCVDGPQEEFPAELM
ncbi:hypothetical protein Baya_7129 [Bagarius yarrelli]|uniref:Uncharacterized protein n=1 Tax=Bagarius yarrelli TaxID=175774 RepID=A0A556TZC1_BAGYA|nr:hypothetical protein Baya_7129 [Bagarius yarrelli]